MDDPIFYTIDEVAQKLRLHPNTIRRLIFRRELGASLFGTRYRITPEQIQEFVKSHTIRTEVKP